MVRIVGVLALTLAACSDSSGGPSPPTSCDPAKFAGTYLVHFDYVSGNCGAVPDTIMIVGGASSAAAAMSSTCTADALTWSHGNCRVDLAIRCASQTGPVAITEYLVQEAADGSRVDGEFSVSSTSGFQTCNGTYRITYTRQ